MAVSVQAMTDTQNQKRRRNHCNPAVGKVRAFGSSLRNQGYPIPRSQKKNSAISSRIGAFQSVYPIPNGPLCPLDSSGFGFLPGALSPYGDPLRTDRLGQARSSCRPLLEMDPSGAPP